MNGAALGTRSLRRRQPLSDGLPPGHRPEKDPAGPPTLRPVSLQPKLDWDEADSHGANDERPLKDEADGRSNVRNGIRTHDDDAAAASLHDNSAPNHYNENIEQDGITGKVELGRHVSIRSEICVSPTWSKTAKKKTRRREKKQQEKDQKDLERKLKREAKGKPREPRRLTKQQGYHSSRASSAHSGFARFSTTGSIRSFWSNRSSRASSIHDPEDRGRDASGRNSISSQAEGVTRPYKFLGIFPRRSGASGVQHRNQTGDNDPLQFDQPARTLHTTRRNPDLRASAREDGRRDSAVEPHQAEGIAHPQSNGHVNSNPTEDRQAKKTKHKRPSKQKPDVPVFSDGPPSAQPVKEFRNISREMYLESQMRGKDGANDKDTVIRSPNSRPPVNQKKRDTTDKRESRSVDKPGDFSEPSLSSKRSPLEALVANAASIIKAEEASEAKEYPSPSLERPSDPANKATIMAEGATEEKVVSTGTAPTTTDAPKPRKQVRISEDIMTDDPGDIQDNRTPNETSEQTTQASEDVAKEVEAPTDVPKENEAPSAKAEVVPNSTELAPVSSPSEPALSSPAEASSSLVDKEKDGEQKDHEPLRKPVIPNSRDPRFQSSPLAAPPLVVQEPEEKEEPNIRQEEETDKNEEARRPAKLRRRSASSSRNEVQSQNQHNSYFGRFRRAGKKEKKTRDDIAIDQNEQQNGHDEERSSGQEGKRPAHSASHSKASSDRADSIPNDDSSNNTTKGVDSVGGGATAPSLPRRSTAPDGSVPTRSRRTIPDATAKSRSMVDNVDLGNGPVTVDSPSKDVLSSAPARNSTATLTLRDLMNDPTMTAPTLKGPTLTKSDNGHHVGSSNMLTTGSTGQRGQRTGFHQGQRVAKMFVICCQCKFWHDMPSEAYANLNFPSRGLSYPRADGGATDHAKREENGRKPETAEPGDNNDITNGARTESSSEKTVTAATSNGAALQTKDEAKPSASSSPGLTLQTSANCCWCTHRMTRSCCAGWTAVVNLHERHH